MRHLALPLCLCTALLAGCDALGIESATKLAERKQAEAHAIGSACRHAIRSIEDCFKTNPRAGKAAVFAGWKEMDQYMRDNQIVGMPSPIEPVKAPEVVEETAEDERPAARDPRSATRPNTSGKPSAQSAEPAATHRS